jgi:type IV pilus assembly protein PilE
MRGFSLIELMIVVAIMTVLAALAYPSYAESVRRSKRIEAQIAMVEVLQEEDRYREDHRVYAAFSAADGAAGPFRWWSGSSAGRSAYEIDAYPCPDAGLEQCVVVRARPGTSKVDAGFREPDCGVLTVDSAGRKGASGTSASCWP